MRIDSFDGTLVCEDNDLQETLLWLNEERITPDYIERKILEHLYQHFGLNFEQYKSICELLNNIPPIKLKVLIKDIDTMFFSKETIDYKDFHISYLFYYLEANLYKIWKPLLDLHINSLLKAEINVLDIGTGPGSIPIGIFEYYKQFAISNKHIKFSVIFTLIEAEKEFINIAVNMITELNNHCPENLTISLKKPINALIDANYTFQELGKFDLIVLSNMLTINEKNNHQSGNIILKKLMNNIEEDGAIVVIEPGDKENGQTMKSIRNIVISECELNLYSPCVRLWEKKDGFNCMCFSPARAYWSVPQIHRFLSENGLHKASRTNIPFHYLVYRKDGKTKYGSERNTQHYIQLNDIKDYVDNRINVKGIIRSVIEIKSNDLIILICDGSCSFSEFENEIKINISANEIIKMGIISKVIVGERITLKDVLVKKERNGFRLLIDEFSKIKIDY